MMNKQFLRQLPSPISLLCCISYLTLLHFFSPSLPQQHGKIALNEITTTTADISFGDGSNYLPQQCLAFNFEVDNLVKSAKQVFIAMPPKAAGSTMKRFTWECMNDKLKPHTVPMSSLKLQNVSPSSEGFMDTLMGSLQVPSILTGHAHGDSLEGIVKAATDETLVIFIYRDETDRMISAIGQVMKLMCRGDYRNIDEGIKPYVHYNEDTKECIIEEKGLVRLISTHPREIGRTTITNKLTCPLYEAIEENKTNIVFMHYKQADKLEMALAKYHCPDLLSEGKVPIKKVNDASTLNETFHVRLTSEEGRIVLLEEWTDAKKHILEWAFGLKKNVSCQGKTRDMEKAMFSCKDEIIKM
jgi:hypothetical protein